jgi:hypothetical protein
VNPLRRTKGADYTHRESGLTVKLTTEKHLASYQAPRGDVEFNVVQARSVDFSSTIYLTFPLHGEVLGSSPRSPTDYAISSMAAGVLATSPRCDDGAVVAPALDQSPRVPAALLFGDANV